MDPHLVSFSEDLREAVALKNLSFAGDIPEVVDIVQGTIDLLQGDSFDISDLPESYQVQYYTVD